jgi:hypothetical protein
MTSPTPPARHKGWIRRQADRYVRSADSPNLTQIRAALWNSDNTDSGSPTVLEQYKIYVEMADRVSARRGLANTFFLTLNTAVFTVVGVFWQHPPGTTRGLLVVPWFALVVQCLAWFWLLRSYRQLNTAKYAVVGALEERLPASPYWRAEWVALGEGRDPSRYWPLSHVEQWIPIIFALVYTAGLLAVLLS